MKTKRSKAEVVEVPSIKAVVYSPQELDRFISRPGLDHLLRRAESLKAKRDGSRVELSTQSSDEDRRAIFGQLDPQIVKLEELENFLRVARVIEDSDQYKNLPDGEIWLGTMVTFIDDEYGEQVMLLLNYREKDMGTDGILGRCGRDDALISTGASDLTQLLLGKRVSDRVKGTVNGQARSFVIDTVTKQLGG